MQKVPSPRAEVGQVIHHPSLFSRYADAAFKFQTPAAAPFGCDPPASMPALSNTTSNAPPICCKLLLSFGDLLETFRALEGTCHGCPGPESLRTAPFPRGDTAEPVGIEADCEEVPCIGEAFFHKRSREVRQAQLSRVGYGALVESSQKSGGLAVKVALRHARIRCALASEITPDIAAIFKQQSVRIILRMALQQDEQAFPLFDENIGSSAADAREQAVSAVHQFFFGQIVPSGMRYARSRRQARGERMPGGLFAFIHAALFARETAPLDAIDMPDCRMRRETGTNHRISVLFAPVEKLRQTRPV